MKKTTIDTKRLWWGVAFVLAAGVLIGIFAHSLSAPTRMEKMFSEKDMAGKRMEFLSEKGIIITEMQEQGMYRCCLEKPCTYCIEKTPQHGEGAACNCSQDVLNGKHPCGECIGEILEGHGEPELAKYFARSIADEVGEQYLETLKNIIADKYGIPAEEQA